MIKSEKIIILMSIFEKFGLTKEEIEQNKIVLEKKDDVELEKLIESLLEILNNQKNLDLQLLQKLKIINFKLDEEIENIIEKENLNNNFNF